MAFGEHMNVLCHACIGGKSISDDMRALQAGMHVVSGTPGRVFDMIRRRVLNTKGIKMLVIDEADEMLGRGFKEQLYDIYRYLPPETQVCDDVSFGRSLSGSSSLTPTRDKRCCRSCWCPLPCLTMCWK